MCTELNGFAQRSLYFLHFWNETKKKEQKRDFFGGQKTWVLFSSKIFVLLQARGCTVSIHHPPVSQNPCLEAGSGSQESDGAPMKDAGRRNASFVYFPPPAAAESVSTYYRSPVYNKQNFVQPSF